MLRLPRTIVPKSLRTCSHSQYQKTLHQMTQPKACVSPPHTSTLSPLNSPIKNQNTHSFIHCRHLCSASSSGTTQKHLTTSSHRKTTLNLSPDPHVKHLLVSFPILATFIIYYHSSKHFCIFIRSFSLIKQIYKNLNCQDSYQ